MQQVTRESSTTAGWHPYFLAFYSYFAFAILFQTYPPLFDALRDEFGVTRQQTSLAMALFLAPLVVFAVPAGLVVDRFSVRRVGRVAFLLMTLGALVSASASSFPVLLAGRVVSGMGGGLLIITVLKVITQTFSKERLGLALGAFATGLPVGTGVAFNLLHLLERSSGWRATALAGALITMSAFFVFDRLLDERNPGGQRGGRSMNMTLVFRNKEVWRIAVVTVFGYMAIIAFTTWVPSTLVGYAGIPIRVGLALASLLLIVDIPFAPLWGILSDRLGKRKVFVVMAFVIYLVGSLIVPYIAQVPGVAIPGLLVVIGGMGIGCAMFFPAALAIPAENVGPEQAGSAYGVLFTAQVAGMMGGPNLLAFVLDNATTYMGFLTISIVTLAGLLASLSLKTR